MEVLLCHIQMFGDRQPLHDEWQSSQICSPVQNLHTFMNTQVDCKANFWQMHNMGKVM